MFRNHFKIATRVLMRQKLFTLINVIGLSIGISASIVIGLIVYHDLTFDKFHKDADRIYRVVTDFSFDGRPSYNPGVTGALSAAVKSEVTGLQSIATTYRILLPDVFVDRGSDKAIKFKAQRGVVLVDNGYFKIFEYKWLSGSAKTAFQRPNQVVITSKQAKIYFPDFTYVDMIGKTVIYDSIKTTVSGVVENFKENSDLTFHDFVSYNTHLTSPELKADLRLDNWGGTSVKEQLFVKLLPGVDPVQIERQLNTILIRNRPEALNKERTQRFTLQPFSDIHFSDRYLGIDTTDRHGNKAVLYGLLLIAGFLLALACINFINLNTAQASQRATEIGIRKTMGSSRKQIILQFLSETFVVTLLAVIISVGLCPFILQLFDGLIPQGITISAFTQPPIIVFLIGLTVVVSLLSGIYPAMILSAYRPVAVLKDKSGSNSGKTRSGTLRRLLTASQFVIAQFFIMATILVSKQVYYATHKDLGFKKDAVVTITSPFRHRTARQNALLAQKFRDLPQIEMVSIGHDAPSSENTSSTEATYNNGKKVLKAEVSMKIGDENYIKLYHIKLLAGRNLQPADTNHAVLINQTYARMMGFQNLNGAIGQYIDDFNGDQRLKIIGVIRDFQQESMHASLTPLVIIHTTDVNWNATLHVSLKPQGSGGDEWQKAIANLRSAWKQVYPGHEFEYEFVDRSIANLYQNEQRTTKLLNWATGLSVLISCLGLLGLSIFTTGQRVKEIGVRKVLGASLVQIVFLLTKEVLWLIALAFIVVLPIAWYALSQWLQNFTDRTAISWWIFVSSGSGMLIVALITSGLQTMKAALANPVKSLRSE